MTLTQITEKGIKDGEIVNADINASAAIAKSKLASLDIVNGDINASAAIARSKVADFVEDNVNDRVLTATGTANTLQAEPKLLFTSSGGDPVLTITGSSTSGHAQLNLKTGGTTDHGSINFGDNDDDDAGEIRYTHQSNLLAFDTAGTPKMVIDANGQVGIGTSSPSKLLELQSNTPVLRILDTDTTLPTDIENSSGDLVLATASVHRDVVFTADGTEKVRMHGDGDITIANGVINFSTSGNGIDFSATSDPSGKTSELLDDYEEGTWTPVPLLTYNPGGRSINAASGNEGIYVKIGRFVHVEYKVGWTSISGSGAYNVGASGLPYAADTTVNVVSGTARSNQTGYTFVAEGLQSSQINVFRRYDNGGPNENDVMYGFATYQTT